jgi:hypothetical protein
MLGSRANILSGTGEVFVKKIITNFPINDESKAKIRRNMKERAL